ncbi:hypothetical protein [Secundilactobacillus malefermentans]|uniref:hypothetical protein n=1 Tax=Secundilactobacillus malefermentans TaxID=176292 RepID=UPI0011C7E746|nr:hypothetical protein [Secundilactobacillus malefermentans]QEA32125.1 hypothetical protein FGL90_07980 [Secundilactobacillus malefermentans]
MDELDQSLIHEYMNIRYKQTRIKARFKSIKHLFWEQSFIRSPFAIDDNGNPESIVRYDRQVNALIDLEALSQQTQTELNFKRNYFNKYLMKLPNNDYMYLVMKYRKHGEVVSNALIEQQTLNECNQIEEATEHRFGLEVEVSVEPKEDVNEMMNQVLGMIS